MEKYSSGQLMVTFVVGCILGWILAMIFLSDSSEQEYHLQPTIEVLSQCKQPSKLLITNGKLGVECASGVRFENLLEGE